MQMDLRTGGSYRLVMEAPDGKQSVAIGTYREIMPPSRISYTWAWESHRHGPKETDTVVTVEFTEQDGGTLVTLTHEGFGTEKDRDDHEQGWSSSLNRFTALFA
jgi:uncharacterized protein YndB with AHSA1/START domain